MSNRTVSAMLGLLCCVMAAIPCAAQPSAAQPLPDDAPPSGQTQKTGTVSGFVEDTDGDGVVGAQVTLLSGTLTLKTVVGPDGAFALQGVPSGPFKIAVTAPGFAAGTVTGALSLGQALDLPVITLPAGASEDVEVTISPQELAQIEVRAEEHQRLGGVVPNFFVVYDWKAPPLSSRQKFDLAFKTVIDPASFVIEGAIAGVQQAGNDFSGYHQGASGYAKRYGAGFADFTVGTFVGGAILPSLFHQDPRYFYKGTGTVRARLFYALSTSFICKGDNGKWQPNYSSMLGDLAAGAVSNLYYPASDRNGVSLTFENALLSIASDSIGNAVQEFLFKHLTPKVPDYTRPSP